MYLPLRITPSGMGLSERWQNDHFVSLPTIADPTDKVDSNSVTSNLMLYLSIIVLP